MKRLIVNFGEIEATPENLEHSVFVSLKYVEKFPEAERVSVSWYSPTEIYVFSGRRHSSEMMFFGLEAA